MSLPLHDNKIDSNKVTLMIYFKSIIKDRKSAENIIIETADMNAETTRIGLLKIQHSKVV